MNMRINNKVAEIDIAPNCGYVLASANLIWSGNGIARAKFKVKRAFKGLKLVTGGESSTIAISATLNRDIQFIELSGQSIYCPVDKLVAYDATFLASKEKIKLKSKVRFHKLKGIRLSGNGFIGLAFEGKFVSKQLNAGESIQIGADYLLAAYANKEVLSGQIVEDNLLKFLFKDGYDGRVTIAGPAVVYYQSEKVVQPVEKI